MLYISTGLVFMLLPGTFLGVWNLVAISSHRAGLAPRTDRRILAMMVFTIGQRVLPAFSGMRGGWPARCLVVGCLAEH